MKMQHVDPDDLLGKAYDSRIAKRLFGYVLPYRHRGLAVIALTIIATGSDLMLPVLFARGVDVVAGDDGSMRALNIVGAAFILTLIFRFLAMWGQFYLTSWIGNRVVFDLRNAMFRHLQKLSIGYLEKRGVGAIMTRIQNDVAVINELFADGIAGILANLLVLVGIVIIMLITDWQLALLAFCILPVMAAVMIYWRRRAVDTYRATRRTIGIVNADLAESIAGVRVVQAFTREQSKLDQFTGYNRDNLKATVNAARLSSILLPLVLFIGSAATATALYVGGRLTFDAHLTVGQLVLFIALIDRFFEPIRDLSQQYTTLQASMAAGERIFEVLDVVPEIEDRDDAYPLPPIVGDVQFRNVTFGYGATPVLRDIDLHVPAGQSVALVGETGAGKSSFINLLMRFHDVWEGAIEIDGHDLRSVTQESLRSQMGIVLQDTFLFGGSVRENIRFGRPGATDAEVERAAREVGAHAFIEHLPDGYDTPVQERGTAISVGQRQLLSFARALLADPRILILDEATSSIDTQTERQIQAALRRLLQGRTSFAIAHRLSTIREARMVVVLRQGRIVETGTHDELIARGGYYAGLHAAQWRGEDAAD
jgi:ATP-binding cassette, subfamily B, multidrug efflux pump